MTKTVEAVRAEFEPQLISPAGCHLTAKLCRIAWEESSKKDIPAQIATAVAWLQMVNRLKTINRRQTSYGYKHEVEWWAAASKRHQYVSNGSFLMAAKRLGFLIQPHEATYCCSKTVSPSGFVWDCNNAFLNIGAQRPDWGGDHE
jgi:hypothetical protein